MKKLLLVLASAWLAGCAGDQTPGKPQDATAFFKPDFDKICAAWSTLDASKAAPFYAKDPNLAFFDVTPLQYKGWQDYEDGFKKATADYKSLEVTLEPDFRAMQLGNIAWATYTFDLVVQPKTGDVVKQQGRGTDVLEKRGERWLIVHEHVSVPMAQEQQPKAKAHKAKLSSHQKAAKKRRK
jgi:ketosteroid isomerase-like protein